MKSHQQVKCTQAHTDTDTNTITNTNALTQPEVEVVSTRLPCTPITDITDITSSRAWRFLFFFVFCVLLLQVGPQEPLLGDQGPGCLKRCFLRLPAAEFVFWRGLQRLPYSSTQLGWGENGATWRWWPAPGACRQCLSRSLVG